MEVPVWTRVSALIIITGSIFLTVGSVLTYVYWDNIDRRGTFHRSEFLPPGNGSFCGPMLVAAGLILVASGTCLRVVLWRRRIQYGLARQISSLDEKFYPTSILEDTIYPTTSKDDKADKVDDKYELNNKLKNKYNATNGLDAHYYQNIIFDVKYDRENSLSEGHSADPALIKCAKPRRSSLMMQLTGRLPGSGDMGSRLPTTSQRDESNLCIKDSDETAEDVQIQALLANRKRRDTLAVILNESIHIKDLPLRRMSLHDQCSLLKTQSVQCVNAVKQKFKFHKPNSTVEEEEEEQVRVSILGHIYNLQEEIKEKSNEEIDKQEKCNLHTHAPMLKDIGPQTHLEASKQQRLDRLFLEPHPPTYTSKITIWLTPLQGNTETSADGGVKQKKNVLLSFAVGQV